MRMVRLILTLGTASVMAACGGITDPIEPKASGPEPITLTFSPTGCAYDGPGETTSTKVAVDFVNETTEKAHVDLLSIDQDHTFADFEAHVAQEQAGFDAGDQPMGPPAFLGYIATVETPPSSTGSGTISVSDGTIVFACITYDGQHGTIRAAGPLLVTG